jgi:hypothetical protein
MMPSTIKEKIKNGRNIAIISEKIILNVTIALSTSGGTDKEPKRIPNAM